MRYIKPETARRHDRHHNQHHYKHEWQCIVVLCLSYKRQVIFCRWHCFVTVLAGWRVFGPGNKEERNYYINEISIHVWFGTYTPTSSRNPCQVMLHQIRNAVGSNENAPFIWTFQGLLWICCQFEYSTARQAPITDPQKASEGAYLNRTVRLG